jgi:hypothetical protein
MTSRRGFIRGSVAVAAAGAIGGLGASVHASPRGHLATPERLLKLHAVVVDQRFEASVEFGRSLALLGVDNYGMSGDVTDVWYSRLDPLWRTGGVAVAGLTGSGVLFCLERLAWDHRLRVVYRGSHQRFADGRVHHAALGSADWSALRRNTANQNSSWPNAVAAAVAGIGSPCSAVPPDRTLARVCTTDMESQGCGGDFTLFSWVIAPAARA